MKVQKNLAIKYIKAKLSVLTMISPSLAGREIFKLFCTPLSRYNAKPSAILKDAEILRITLNWKKIYGYRINNTATRKVLLLHGFSSSCHNFDHFVKPLIDAGYEVLAFDAPAHGLSEGRQVHALDYANLIIHIQENFGPIDTFIAHSFGGIAVSLALEKISHSPKTKVVLLAPATETATAIDKAFSMLGLENKILRKAIDDEIFRLSQQHAGWYSIRRAMKNIQASVLWIHDKDDEVTPYSDVEKVQDDHLPHIQFIITEGLGHRRIYRDKKVLGNILEFVL